MSEEQVAKLDTIRYTPSDGLTYDPDDPRYWRRDALRKELDRTFELCHGCRMCFKFCRSFPTLFDAVDRHDDVRRIPEATVDRVIDQCFQCKLCYTNCPYTENEGHDFRLDFPRLMLRANAVRRRERGVPLRERLLGDPDRLGRLACRAAPLANAANRFRPHRLLLERLLGIHRDKLLPRFAGKTFQRWVETEAPPTEGRPVVLFATCFVQYNRPQLGMAAHRVLARNGCGVACPQLECCGMPALDGGDVEQARARARRNVERLHPYVARGSRVAVINPTCSLMMRQEYPELLGNAGDDDARRAVREVAGATRDVGEFLHELGKEGKFQEDFASTPDGPVAYHAPCHLRMQNVGFRGRDLMRRIPGVKPRLVAECCGHDGTWAMKREYFAQSLKQGEKAFDGMRAADAGLWTTDCPLAAVQFEQVCGKRALHPIEVLDRAYREDGFPTRVRNPEEPDDRQHAQGRP